MGKLVEADLFKPVHTYFESLGYKVQAEVNDCDVVAYKNERITN